MLRCYCESRHEPDRFLIHHGNPVAGAVEHDDMRKMPITGHYRWDGSRI